MATTSGVAHGIPDHEHAHDVPHHDYHLVDPSPWPVVGSFAALWMHEHAIGKWLGLLGFLGVLFTMAGWWRDVLRESATGHHKPVVNRGLRMGMVLFITSEVLFFFAFF